MQYPYTPYPWYIHTEVQEVQSVNSAYTAQGDASLSGTFDAGDIRSINLATWQSPS